MIIWLIMAFVVVPIVELTILIQLGSILHLGPTLLLVLVTGIIGAAMAKHQGLSTMTRIQSDLADGHMPTSQLADGLMILFAAALLITPGFLTDCTGFLLLIPGFRRILRKALTRYLETKIIVQAKGIRTNHIFQDGFGGLGDSANEAREDEDVFIPDDEHIDPHHIKHVENEALHRKPS